MGTTSLKLPDDIKQLAVSAAMHQWITPHAFMVEAIRATALAAVKRAGFVADALAPRAKTLASGKGCAADEVNAYIRARAGKKARSRPEAKSWRD
ncbi:CopG family transcriptional regulator [Parazoarcus communis]|uniref:CopG family transcriptional regulator n=2 Tax=Parazoarcus communis TaxID=41977 RepID=A0A2U8H1Q2_9RHOO|nr:CopG family transcriptional regulator [Parazoarcus communis]